MGKRWNLKGKNALITGATKGIGKAIAKEFASLGADVFITSRHKEDIDNIKNEFSQYGYNITGLEADVLSKERLDDIFNQIEKKWGKLNILVNNAGTNIRKRTNEYDEKEIDFLINTNYRAAFDYCRKFYPLLKSSGSGCIINIGSIAGSRIVRTGAPYASSKAALAHLTRYLAVEWGHENIRVNAIEPWYIKTPLTEPVLQNKENLKKILDVTPMNRTGEPEEISGLAAFLAMEGASYLSGEVIAIDGAAGKLMF